jgi:hypothetical protein
VIRVNVGFKAHMGWVAAVAVNTDSSSPNPLYTRRIDLVTDQDRCVREPYHVAGGWDGLEQVPRPDNPAEIVAHGLKLQTEAATLRLEEFRSELTAIGLEWSAAVILTTRGYEGGLHHSLDSHAHIHVAEGSAIRDATRIAVDKLGIARIEQDEKSSMQQSSALLRLSVAELDAQLKKDRPVDTRSWTKEHRTIAAATWLASQAQSP